TVSSPSSSMRLSASAAASNCSSFHKPWRSTKLRAFLSSEDDTEHPAAEPGKVSAFTPAVRDTTKSSMHARGACLQAGDEIARSLHRQALVIEAKPMEPAQLLPRSGAPRAAVIALRHDDAVAGMDRGDRGVDGKDAAVARGDLGDHADEKILVL